MGVSEELRGELGAVALAGWARASLGRSSRPGRRGCCLWGPSVSPELDHARLVGFGGKGARTTGDARALGEV